jgi:L-tartrate/succinate antiporter
MIGMLKKMTRAIDPANANARRAADRSSSRARSPRPRWWTVGAPIATAILIALLPAPAGLPPHAWHFFSIFTAVIVALVLEPLPGGAIGLIGVTTVAVLAPVALYSPAQLAQPGFKPSNAALTWALSGFSDGTVWLIFAAFMFSLGYEKTGLGKRIALILVKLMGKRTLTLGYAVAAADTILAPFTPSNTARSAGVIYPVICNLPPLYASKPNDASARRLGSYIMWVAIATVSVTSSLFLTGLAPNLLAIEMVRKTTQVEIRWSDWFIGFAPVGIFLLILVPILTYWLYPPEIKQSSAAPAWADGQLQEMGPLSSQEAILGALVLMALVLWIFGGTYVNATTTALVVISLMLITRILTWHDIVANEKAWNILAWFATLVALADGLNRVGFVKWFADSVAAHVSGVSPTTAMVILLIIFFVAHYLFASLTAHTTALLPPMLAVGSIIPGLPMRPFALLLCFELGMMGILTPYATGPSPIYYNSGYLPSSDYWRLGMIFGAVFLLALLVIGVPWTTSF